MHKTVKLDGDSSSSHAVPLEGVNLKIVEHSLKIGNMVDLYTRHKKLGKENELVPNIVVKAVIENCSGGETRRHNFNVIPTKTSDGERATANLAIRDVEVCVFLNRITGILSCRFRGPNPDNRYFSDIIYTVNFTRKRQ